MIATLRGKTQKSLQRGRLLSYLEMRWPRSGQLDGFCKNAFRMIERFANRAIHMVAAPNCLAAHWTDRGPGCLAQSPELLRVIA